MVKNLLKITPIAAGVSFNSPEYTARGQPSYKNIVSREKNVGVRKVQILR
jgi:hypothetical protein